MILNRTGAAFIYDDVTYRIGDSVVANAESVYHGLIGTITEIRDGADKETEYCVKMDFDGNWLEEPTAVS